MQQPMRHDPPQFRIMGARWFAPHETDGHRSPVYLLFTIVFNERRAIAIARDPDGRLYGAEYHEVIEEPPTGQGPFAARIDGEADPIIAVIGDPLDAWIVGGHLPK
jgi:hypothetical protein